MLHTFSRTSGRPHTSPRARVSTGEMAARPFQKSLERSTMKAAPAAVRGGGVLFRPKVSQSQLQASARVIQLVARQRMRRKMIDAFESGKLKRYEQKHACSAMEGAAALIAARVRGNASRDTLQDKLDEAEVDRYTRQKQADAAQKQFTFTPRYPASYYRGAAAIIQRRAKASGCLKSRPEPPAPVVPKRVPRIPLSKLRAAVVMIQALERGGQVRRRKQTLTQTVAAATTAISLPPRSKSSPRMSPRLTGSSVALPPSPRLPPPSQPMPQPVPKKSASAAKLLRPAALPPSRASPHPAEAPAQLPPSRAAPPPPVCSAAAAAAALRDDPRAVAAAAAAVRQQQAEDDFLLADTSGDGYVDEDELCALCTKLMSTRQQAGGGGGAEETVLRKYLQTFRTEPSTPLNLDFDAFVGVYNSFVTAQLNGELASALVDEQKKVWV